MTTTKRMDNFKRLVERLALGEKLLTTKEKVNITKGRSPTYEERAVQQSETDGSPVRLVMRAGKKHVPQ